jgi:amidase
MTDLCFLSAVELSDRIRRRELSAREVMAAHLDRIERVNPTVNAIVSMLPREACLAAAGLADQRVASGAQLGPLHGLPIAFKDLEDAVGFPTSSGSPIHAGTYPESDSAIVERLRAAGVVPIGKTNVPEFGLGSHTYNRVFGPTRNPYDLSKSAGGSSGGAGAALATGMLPIADGSDMGGSLRNPGNFNNVVGFRPSAGLIPRWPSGSPWLPLSVKGPLARSVDDIALLLQAMAGHDARDQLSRETPAGTFATPVGAAVAGRRVAWAPDLGGLPLDPAVRRVLDDARPVFEALGLHVEEAVPDLTDADWIFGDLRAFSLTEMADLLEARRADLKPEAVWNIEEASRSPPATSPPPWPPRPRCMTGSGPSWAITTPSSVPSTRSHRSPSTSPTRPRSTGFRWRATSPG